jgi:hypothetical protein
MTLIRVSRLFSPPLIPNTKCIAWNFDGSNFVQLSDRSVDLLRLRFENGDIIPNVVESYFTRKY